MATKERRKTPPGGHKKVQGKANHSVAVKAAKRRRFTAEMWALAKDRLAKGWTFEQIHGRCRRDGIAMVCAETLFEIARPQGPCLRKAESPAEARFTSPNQNCYNTDNKQESFVSTGLRNECCSGYWMAGRIVGMVPVREKNKE